MKIEEVLKERRVETVNVPEVGMIPVRRLSLAQLDAIEAISDGKASNAELIRQAIVNEEGNPVFATDKEVFATDWIIVKALLDAALKVNRLDVKAAKKNLTASTSPSEEAASTSNAGSPSVSA